MEFIIEPVKKTQIIEKADVVIVGGGPAGCGAALRAARNGQRALIIERFGILGGTNTSGFMFVDGAQRVGKEERQYISTEIYNRLRPEGYVVNLEEEYPEMTTNPLNHWGTHGRYRDDKRLPTELQAFDPDMLAYVINEMMEEANVKLLMRTLFVAVKVENDTIQAVIVENTSGRFAVEGKIFIDATGRGDLVAHSGVPYVSARSELGVPMPPGLMWKMTGVNYEKLVNYQNKSNDPLLKKLIEKAKAKGELPYYRAPKADQEMEQYDIIYTGHDHPEMCHTAYPGDMLMWMPAPVDLGLNCAENIDDLNRAEASIRKQIAAELKFLKKYVPGFENAHLAGIAPSMGIREGRHPLGEYVLTFDDIRTSRKFDDVVIRLRASDVREPELGKLIFDIPYRSFLPKKIDNLLLAGDLLSADHAGFVHIRGFGNSMKLGEVAGISASVSLKNKVKPKEIGYSILEKELLAQAFIR